MPALRRDNWPEDLQPMLGLRGVYVEGCIDGRRSFRRRAHAHTHGRFAGWICYRSRKRLCERLLALHELAHIITGDGHSKRWKAALGRLSIERGITGWENE